MYVYLKYVGRGKIAGVKGAQTGALPCRSQASYLLATLACPNCQFEEHWWNNDTVMFMHLILLDYFVVQEPLFWKKNKKQI